MARLFISYSRADRQFVDDLVPLLREVYGQDCLFFDEQIYGGANWWALILSEIATCDLFIYLCSNDSLTSSYCQGEFREALRLQKQILPVIVRPKTVYPGDIPEDLAETLSNTQRIDLSLGFRDRDQSQRQTAKLFRAINLLLATIASVPPEPLTPYPIPQPQVGDKKKRIWLSEPRAIIIGAVITGAFGIFGVVLTLANSMQNQPQGQENPTAGLTRTIEIVAGLPTTSGALISTPDWTATADTSRLEVQLATLSAQGTLDAQATSSHLETLSIFTQFDTLTIVPSAEPTLTRTPPPTSTSSAIPQPIYTFTPTLFATTRPSATSNPIQLTSTNIGQVMVTVNVQSANLRTGPGTGYSIAGTAQAGMTFLTTGRTQDNSWYRIERVSGQYAWISAQIVTINGSNSNIQIVATVPAPLENASSQIVSGGGTISLDTLPSSWNGSVSETQSATYIVTNSGDWRTVRFTMSSNGVEAQCSVLFSGQTLAIPEDSRQQFLQSATTSITRQVVIPTGNHVLNVYFLNYESSCPPTLSYTFTVSP